MNKNWLISVFGRRVAVITLLVVQIAFIVYTVVSGSVTSTVINNLLIFLSTHVCIYILSKRYNSAYKLTWIFLIMRFPIFGGLFYLFFGFQSTSKRISSRLEKIQKKAKKLSQQPSEDRTMACREFAQHTTKIRYLADHGGFPVYRNSSAEYLSPGEKMFERLMHELQKAEKYIFIESFIIEQGLMWDSILDILKKKAAAGVEVRVIYDDVGCFLLLPTDYPKHLAKYGIKCKVFNKFNPLLTTVQNNRDHRKIAVIDGTVAFTGGINLADEYINAVDKFGHWKDASVMLCGNAAWSLTLMFLQMWELRSGESETYSRFYPNRAESTQSDGYIQPYADSPMDSESVGEQVYLQIISNAKSYVYIHTPYLIIDDKMMSALCLAAKSGVDVRIVTPHRWDKWAVHMVTRSYYRQLTDAGVKIYEYSKGFIHSKVFISDDSIATVGTFNLDFRSLYLHFECGVVMYGSKAVAQAKDDFMQTLDVCIPITEHKRSLALRLLQSILRLFAPLM